MAGELTTTLSKVFQVIGQLPCSCRPSELRLLLCLYSLWYSGLWCNSSCLLYNTVLWWCRTNWFSQWQLLHVLQGSLQLHSCSSRCYHMFGPHLINVSAHYLAITKFDGIWQRPRPFLHFSWNPGRSWAEVLGLHIITYTQLSLFGMLVMVTLLLHLLVLYLTSEVRVNEI